MESKSFLLTRAMIAYPIHCRVKRVRFVYFLENNFRVMRRLLSYTFTSFVNCITDMYEIQLNVVIKTT